jgi:hypothetical protein
MLQTARFSPPLALSSPFGAAAPDGFLHHPASHHVHSQYRRCNQSEFRFCSPKLPDDFARGRAAEWRDVQQHPRFDVSFYRFLQTDDFIFAFILFQAECTFGKFF